MKHAFILNCHNDIDQVIKTTQLLKKYWSQHSKIFVYFDGPQNPELIIPELQKNADLVLHAPYEENKCNGILKALNALMEYAGKDGIEITSFLHADMIPLYPESFYSFLKRFEESGKIMTYTPASPKSPVLDFCNLHFSVPKMTKFFPVTRWEYNDKPQYDFNEFQVTLSFTRTEKNWKEQTYLMWMISWPLHLIEGIAWNGSFVFHNFVPESSVVHTNDPWFWENYETLSVFKDRSYPQEIR